VIAVTNEAHPELPAELAERRCAPAQAVEILCGGRTVAHYDIDRCPPVP
jgi:hypothetical protein